MVGTSVAVTDSRFRLCLFGDSDTVALRHHAKGETCSNEVVGW